MPMPIPTGKQITVQRDVYPYNFCMPTMEVATLHYDINYIISGDRKMITPSYSYSYHSGDVSMGEPFTYHRTISESNMPYERILIKFTPEFVDPFLKQVGMDIFGELYKQRLFHFSEQARENIEKMFFDMLFEYGKDVPYKEVILQGMLFRLLTNIYENKLNVEMTKYKTSLTEPVLNCIYYIENHYNDKISIEAVAELCHFSCSHFSRLFNSQLGMSFSEYLGNVRIGHAKRLLLQTDKSITEIALDTGFCNGDYLSARFKNKVGMTPTAFRKNNRKNSENSK